MSFESHKIILRDEHTCKALETKLAASFLNSDALSAPKIFGAPIVKNHWHRAHAQAICVRSLRGV